MRTCLWLYLTVWLLNRAQWVAAEKETEKKPNVSYTLQLRYLKL